jgi:hypothetical protein
LIGVTARALREIAELRFFYERELRLDAIRSLDRAIDEAGVLIERDPGGGLPAPRPYPWVARPGQAWRKVRAYWFRYSLTSPPVITAVFYERANIPGRL